VTSVGRADRIPAARARHAWFHGEIARDPDLVAIHLRGGTAWLRCRARRPDLQLALTSAHGELAARIAIVLTLVLNAEGPLEECVTVARAAMKEPGVSGRLRATLLRHEAVALRNLGRVDEARASLHAALGAASAEPEERARVHRATAVLEAYHGNPAAARIHLGEALRGSDTAATRLDRAVALAELGTLDFREGRLREAIQGLEAALAILRADGDGWAYGVYLVNLGVAELISHQPASARLHLREALALHRRGNAQRYVALALGNLALVEAQLGNYADAHTIVDEALALSKTTGDASEEANLHSTRGLLHLSEGRYDEASAALERAGAMAVRLSEPRLEAEVSARRARVYAARGEVPRGEALVARALDLARMGSFRTEAIEACIALVELRLAAGDGAEEACAALLDRIGDPAEATRDPRVQALQARLVRPA